MTCPTPSTVRSRSAAFTVVEVVIAVLIMSIVVSGITLASTGGSKLRSAAKLQSAMTATGLSVQEDVVTDRSWMDRPECRSLATACDVASVIRPDSLELDGISTRGLATTAMQVASATSQAIDSPVDKRGDQDTDGVVPDFYRIDMTLNVPQAVASRYSSTSAQLTRRLTTTIDRRGKEQEGSLAVEVCEVVNQSDERMAVQGCAEAGSSAVKMDGCPPVPRAGCDAAFAWIAGQSMSSGGASPFVVMRRVPSVSFTVVNITSGRTWSSGSATRDKGLFIFQNLPAGAYRIDGLPDSLGNDTERWQSKELPQFHGSPQEPITGDATVVVESGLRNRALVMFRPSIHGSHGIEMYADREVHDYHLDGPLGASEMVVDEGTPTSSYQGTTAEMMCSSYSGGNSVSDDVNYSCVGLRSGPANCLTLYISGFSYESVGAGAGNWKREVGSQGQWYELAGGGYEKVFFTNLAKARFCTTYSEQHAYTYYAATGPTGAYYLPGAVQGGMELRISPMPDNRIVEVAGGTVSVPSAKCVIASARSQCASNFIGLQPGLNSDATKTVGAAAAAANTNVIGLPSWMTSGAMWVRPTGHIDTPAGSRAPNPYVHIRGKGECYWTSTRFSGKVEGPCDRCQPVWTGAGGSTWGCSILERDDVVRTVKESVTSYAIPTGAFQLEFSKVIAVDRYPINFSPPWRCSSSVPSLKRSTCSRQPTGGGGPVVNRGGRYVSPNTGGTAIIDDAPISEGAA